MDQTPDIIKIKKEPTDSTSIDQEEIAIEMKTNFFQQESNSLIQPELYIKPEVQEDESEDPVTECNNLQIYSNGYVQTKNGELIKLEYGYSENNKKQDPLDETSNIKANEHFLTNLDSNKPKIKNEPPESTEDFFFGQHFLDTASNFDSHDGKSSNKAEEDIKPLFSSESKDGEQNKLEESGEFSGRGKSKKKNKLLKKNEHIDKNKITYTCQVCQKTFTKKSNYQSHFIIHTGIKPFTCEICNRSFNRKGIKDRHMLTHSAEKNNACELCGKVFRQKKHLDSHYILMHSEGNPFPCTECDKSFRLKHHLERHILTHTGDRPFSCDICSRSFAQKSHLIRHGVCHTGERRYSCDLCYKLFADKSDLKRHLRLHEKKKQLIKIEPVLIEHLNP